MRIFPDPPPKKSFKSSLKHFASSLAIFLCLGAVFANIKDSIINEYLDENYDSIYESAYSEGFDAGYNEAYLESSVCWNCDSNSIVSSNDYGLCRDCKRSIIGECVFCYSPTLGWDTGYGFSVCHKCLGEACEKTNLEEFLIEFNENR